MQQLAMTQQETIQALNETTNRLDVFVDEVMGLKNASFQDEIDLVLSDPAYKRICIAIARDHGKSTHLSVAYPLWEIAKNHNIRILLVSSTATIASGFLSQVLNHIESNDKYREWARFVDIQKYREQGLTYEDIKEKTLGVVPKKREVQKKDEKWASNAIVIDRDELNVKDATIQAIGLYGSILSKRADIVIVDDLVNQQNSETQEQRDKIKDWVDTTLRPILVPGGRFIYLGNTWHQDDLVAGFLKNPQFDYRKRMPAIVQEADDRELWNQWANIYLDESLDVHEKNTEGEKYYFEHKTEMDKGVQVLWPERHSYGALYLKRIENSYSFARMYQCDPSQRPDQKIKDTWLQNAVEKGKELSLQSAPREGLVMRDTTGGLDLAISQKKNSDFTVFLTLDQVLYGNNDFKAGDYIIRNIHRSKYTPTQTKELVEQQYDMIGHTGIRVESVAYQDAMRRDLGDKAIPVRGHHTGGEKNDPDIGVNSLSILLEQGKLILPYNNQDARTIELVSILLNEMRAWPDGHTGDVLMALWFAFLQMRDHKGRSFVHPRPEVTVVQEQLQTKTQEEIDTELDLELMRQDVAARAGTLYVPNSGLAQTDDKPFVRKYSF